MSETATNYQDILLEAAALSEEEEERTYRQGLRDVSSNQLDTPEAQYYMAYWQAKELGEAAVKAAAE